jgi:Tfp pilus assembly protein PilF
VGIYSFEMLLSPTVSVIIEIAKTQRAHAMQGRANVHFKLACLYLERDDRASARKHLAAMARAKPSDERLPRVLAAIVRPGRAFLPSKS